MSRVTGRRSAGVAVVAGMRIARGTAAANGLLELLEAVQTASVETKRRDAGIIRQCRIIANIPLDKLKNPRKLVVASRLQILKKLEVAAHPIRAARGVATIVRNACRKDVYVREKCVIAPYASPIMVLGDRYIAHHVRCTRLVLEQLGARGAVGDGILRLEGTVVHRRRTGARLIVRLPRLDCNGFGLNERSSEHSARDETKHSAS
jgi:hypothetical protein